MAIFTTTMRAYWRESQEPRQCVECKKDGLKTFQTGHKERGRCGDGIYWWPDYHICADCKSGLPDTAPE